jgi:hypothetical protein
MVFWEDFFQPKWSIWTEIILSDYFNLIMVERLGKLI